jgi:hypothetical protein
MTTDQVQTVRLATGCKKRRGIGGGRSITYGTYTTMTETSSPEEEIICQSVWLIITGI